MRPSSFTQFEAQARKAEVLLQCGQPAAALQLYAELLGHRLSLLGDRWEDFRVADLVVIERLADLAALLDQFDAADDLLAGMAALCAQAGNYYGTDYATVKRIHLAAGRGLTDEARELFAQMTPSIGRLEAIEFSEDGLVEWEEDCEWPDADADDHAVLFAQLYLALGQLMATAGQYRSAHAALERGLQHTGAESPDLAQQTGLHLRLILSRVLLEQGKLQEAQASLAAVRAAIDEARQPALAVCEHELTGRFHLLSGEFGTALTCLQQALEICQQSGFAAAALRAALNLAHLLIYLNQTSVAEELLNEVNDRAAEADDPACARRANALLQLCRERVRSTAGGLSLIPSVTEMWGLRKDNRTAPEAGGQVDEDAPANTGSLLDNFEEHALTLQLRLAHGDLPGAERLLDEIKGRFARADSALIEARIKMLAGLLIYYRRDYLRAETMLSEVVAALHTLGLKPELWQAQRVLSWCQTALARPAAAQRALSQDIQKLLDVMAESLAPAERAIFLLNKWTVEEEFLAGEIQHLLWLQNRLDAAPRFWRWRWRWKLLNHLNQLLSRIDSHREYVAQSAVTGEQSTASTIEIPSLWQRLLRQRRDRTTISFLVLPDEVLIVSSGWLQLDFAIGTVTRIELRNLVRRWHELASAGAFQSNGRSAPPSEHSTESKSDAVISRGLGAVPLATEAASNDAGLVDLLRNVADAVQLPLLLSSLPRRVSTLALSPDDCLHGFPFAAVVYENSYLIERFALTIAYSSRRRICRQKPPARLALTIGVTRPAGGLSELQGVPEELSRIEGHLQRLGMIPQRLMDDAADKATILRCLPEAGWLHIACHGVFHADAPDRSGLILAPEPKKIEVLSLRELSGLQLDRLQHVTLSSCWAADTFILPGRWIISLPETLWRAGARNILSCLWVVDDCVAAAFMSRFYSHLDSLPDNEALRRVQLDCLQNRLLTTQAANTSHPLYWAGFGIYGGHD